MGQTGITHLHRGAWSYHSAGGWVRCKGLGMDHLRANWRLRIVHLQPLWILGEDARKFCSPEQISSQFQSVRRIATLSEPHTRTSHQQISEIEAHKQEHMVTTWTYTAAQFGTKEQKQIITHNRWGNNTNWKYWQIGRASYFFHR